MDKTAREQALLTALTTEHFVLQGIRGTITGEGTGRAALYLGALSSALIALGFAVAKNATFNAFAAAVLPLVIVLGLFTFIRLVEIGIEDVQHLQAMQRIRRYYRTLTPDAPSFFPDIDDQEGVARDVTEFMSVFVGARRQALLTAASAIGVINSIVAGVGIALIAAAVGASITSAAVIGAALAVGLMALHVRYQLNQWEVQIGMPPTE